MLLCGVACPVAVCRVRCGVEVKDVAMPSPLPPFPSPPSLWRRPLGRGCGVGGVWYWCVCVCGRVVGGWCGGEGRKRRAEEKGSGR